MVLIVFVLDTSASMNQRSAGLSFLDLAKCTVEQFMKARARDPQSRRDRFALVTCADGATSLRVQPTESGGKLLSEVKSITATDIGTVAGALSKALEMINLRRVQQGADTYAQGRMWWSGEPALIVVITDGGAFTTLDRVQDKVRVHVGLRKGLEVWWDRRSDERTDGWMG